MTTVEERSTQPELLRGRAQTFTMRGLPLLSQGTKTEELVVCENLVLHSKVYNSGGENSLHAHKSDDHAFFVLAGRARFFDKDGTETEVGPLEGIVIPKKTAYRFEAIPPENLVILRMGGSVEDHYTLRSKSTRVGADGAVLEGRDPRNHTKGTAALPAIESGEYFGL